MTEDNSSLSGKKPSSTTQKDEICAECGEPLYTCGCPERWEDEGGLSSPQDDTEDNAGSASKP